MNYRVGAILVLVACLGATMMGCGGGGGGATTLSADLVGTWGAILYNAQGQFAGGGVVTVQTDGDVVNELAAGRPNVGRCTAGGAVTTSITEGNVTTHSTGALQANGTGAGTWYATQGSQQIASGNGHALKATGGALAGKYDLVIGGADTGTGVLTINANGRATGSVTTANVGTVTFAGIVTSQGEVAVFYRVGGQTVGGALGNIVGAGGSGQWYNFLDGSSGTVTITKR